MRNVAVLLGMGALAVLARGDAPPATPRTVEVVYCGSYIPLKGLDLDAPLPAGALTSCSRGFELRPR